jgi:cell division protein ZapA (FtsZ GTPase activity inhibitor)
MLGMAAKARSSTQLSEHYEKISMRHLLVVALLLVTAALAAQQRESRSRAQRPRVEQIILTLDTERIQAQIHADAADLARLYADDFYRRRAKRDVRTKPQVIADFTSGALKFQSITTDDVQVRVYGITAVETGRSSRNSQ